MTIFHHNPRIICSRISVERQFDIKEFDVKELDVKEFDIKEFDIKELDIKEFDVKELDVSLYFSILLLLEGGVPVGGGGR